MAQTINLSFIIHYSFSLGIVFQFSQNNYDVNEGDVFADVCIDLISGVLSANTPIVITPQTGTAGGIKPQSLHSYLSNSKLIAVIT